MQKLNWNVWKMITYIHMYYYRNQTKNNKGDNRCVNALDKENLMAYLLYNLTFQHSNYIIRKIMFILSH